MDYNVTYRKRNGKYQCIISYKTSSGWKQKSKQGFERQKDAKPWITEAVKELKKKVKNDKGFTFKMLIDKYKKDYVRYREDNTMQSFDAAMKHFSQLNDILLEKIKPEDIQECIDKMNDKGLKANTIGTYTVRLKTLFNIAINKYELINSNPARLVTLPNTDKPKKVKALTLSELNSLLATTNNIKRTSVILMAAKCGLRVSEITGLTWADIDFKNETIDINKQWKKLKDGTYGFGKLKSKNGYRTVPMPKDVKEVLEKLQEDSFSNRVFPYKSGGTLSSNLIEFFGKKGYDITPHYLRHTYATTLLSNGLDYKTVAELMGDTVNEIIRTYSHVTSDMLERAKTLVNDVF